MLLPDVNVYVCAFRGDTSRHVLNRDWLSRAVTEPEPVAVSELVLSSFVRIVTNHRIFEQPSTVAAAFGFCDALLDAPAAFALRPAPTHWARFVELCTAVDARGNVVPDTYLAALAIDNGATLVTSDAGFGRFAGLRTLRPE